MFRAARKILLFICLSFALGDKALAHGDLHERLAQLTLQLKHEPENAALFFERGELHRQHGDWAPALSDFNRAGQKGFPSAAIQFAIGKTLYESGKFAEAESALSKFLSGEKRSAEGFALRAKANAKLGKNAAAADDFSRAIETSRAPDPDWFLQRAEVQAAAGGIDEALRDLDTALAKIGPVISLQLRAIDLEVARKNYDAALARLQRIQDSSPRKETWLEQRAEILELAGRQKEAQQACREALTALNLLPASRRNVPAMANLQNQLHARLDRLSSAVPTDKKN